MCKITDIGDPGSQVHTPHDLRCSSARAAVAPSFLPFYPYPFCFYFGF